MSGFADYDRYDALGLAELVRQGEVSSTELLEEAISRTEKVNDAINAVVHKHYDEAKAAIEAGLPEDPFTGVPFLLKDLQLDGTATTYGSKFFRDQVADHDSTLVSRYKHSGLVTFGKTNSPELGLMPVTEPRMYGPTRNPWNLDRTPGGSSGGASAAVAAGIVPMANASDGGGSIRIPASCTGLVGLKPTRGRTPMGPDRGEGWAGQSISHVVSRSVRDSAAVLDATTGTEPGNPYEAPHFDGSFLAHVGKNPGKLRIALCRNKMGKGRFSADVIEAVEEAGRLLSNLGHDVKYAEPAYDREAAGNAVLTLVAANAALAVKMRAEALGREATEQDIEPSTRALIEMAAGLSADDYARATLINHRAGRVFAKVHEQYDLMIAPTLSQEPVPIGFMEANRDGIAEFMGDTAIFNQTGQPAISLPLCWSANQLPIGIMFVAAFGNDALLLRIAGQLEKAYPWSDRRAPVHAGA